MVVDGSPIVIKHGVLANSPFIQFNRLFPVDTQHMYIYIYINYIYIYRYADVLWGSPRAMLAYRRVIIINHH